MTTDTWVTIFDRPDACDGPVCEPGAGSWGPTPFERLGSLLPSIAHEWSRLEQSVATTTSSLTPAERQLAALVVSTINASGYHVRLITDELGRLGVPGWILNAVTRARLAGQRRRPPGHHHPVRGAAHPLTPVYG